MRLFIALIFIFTLLLSTMQELTFVLLYKVNKNTITEKYCINKKVKKACCYGKCHLNKTILLAEKENNTKGNMHFNVKGKELEIIFQKSSTIAIKTFSCFYNKIIYNYTAKLQKGEQLALLKPPISLGYFFSS